MQSAGSLLVRYHNWIPLDSEVVLSGRSASETVLQQANRLSQSYFTQHCAWPPLQQIAGAQLAYRVWHRPLYVAGRYLKLLRGVAQVQAAAYHDTHATYRAYLSCWRGCEVLST